jgi:hypothetical protein
MSDETVVQAGETQKELARIQGIWARCLPGIKIPENSQFFRWSRYAGWEIARHAVIRTGRKYAAARRDGLEMTVDDCERYATSVVKHERAGISPKPNPAYMALSQAGKAAQHA